MKIAGYETLGELGRGGQGAVYRVRDVAAQTVRALKVLEGPLDPETVARFQREAETLARLEGRGVVPVHQASVSGGRLYFVMDLMPGGSLAERLRAGRLEWREAASLGAKLARVLERAHALGLVHRDLKPANVLFDEQGEPRIGDWGCVRDLKAASLTETGAVLGTPGYMAPEQLEGRKVEASADVFSLGVVLHELLTGERPFTGATPVQIYRAIQAGGRVPASARAGSPRALDAVLDRALERDPARRASAAELALGLEALALESSPSKAAPSRAVALGAGLGALALVAAGVSLARGTPPTPAPSSTPVAPATPAPGKTDAASIDSGQVQRRAREEAQNALLRARDAHDRGDDAKALEEIERSLALDPSNAAAQALAADLLASAGEPEKALDHAMKAVEREPALIGRQRAFKGKHEDLRLAVWTIAADRTNVTDAWLEIGWFDLKQRGHPDLDGVRRAAEKAREGTSGRCADASYLLARAAVMEGRFRDAIREGVSAQTEVVSISEQDRIKVRMGAGEPSGTLEGLYELVGEPELARIELDGAVEREKDDAHVGKHRRDARARRAFLDARLGHLEEAKKDLGAARSVTPDKSKNGLDWYLDLADAEIHALEGELDEAIESLTRLREAHTFDLAALEALVQHLCERAHPGDPERALLLCDATIARQPRTTGPGWIPSLLRLRAFALIALHREADAEAELTRAIGLDGALRGAWADRGRLVGRWGRIADGARDLRKAIELSGRGSEERDRLAAELEELEGR